MRNINLATMALILLTMSKAVHASGYQPIWQCSSALRSADLDLARNYAAEIILISPIFGEPTLNKAAACLDYSFGDGWVYDKAVRAFINNNIEINYFTVSLLSTEQNAAYYYMTSNTAYQTEAIVKLEAEREVAEAEEAANQEAARLNREVARLRVCEHKDLGRQYDQTISEAEAASHSE